MAIDVQIGVEYDTPSQPPDNGDGLGLGSRVTRQVGLAPPVAPGFDPVKLPDVIQGSVDIFAERNQGPHVRGHFDGGIFYTDHVADTAQVLYADGGAREGVSNQPPGIARIAAPLVADPNQPVPPRPAGFGNMTAVALREAAKQAAIAAGYIVLDPPAASPAAVQAPAIDVIASDQPGENHDPRDASSGPAVFTADQLPVIKKAAIVPVVVAPGAAPEVVAKNALPEPQTRHIRAKAGPSARTAKKVKK